jgi:tRNA-specific 2-thiouridylase
MCNREIKFGKLLEKARSLGAEYVATGHYANVAIDKKTGRALLKAGKDKAKDQSYFLFNLEQEQLKHILFPLGGITKTKARAIAKKMRLNTYNTASSQDICFVRDGDYADYISKKTGVKFKPGDIVDKNGKVMGKHKGIPSYTIGQRRGLGVAYSEPLYVTGMDLEKNRIVVGTRNDVMRDGLVAKCMNWISVDDIDDPVKVMAKIRYNHKAEKATIVKLSGGRVRVVFDKPQAAPTPGQAVVFYNKDTVLGGGWIEQAE